MYIYIYYIAGTSKSCKFFVILGVCCFVLQNEVKFDKTPNSTKTSY